MFTKVGDTLLLREDLQCNTHHIMLGRYVPYDSHCYDLEGPPEVTMDVYLQVVDAGTRRKR